MRSKSERNLSAYADQIHTPSFTCVQLEFNKEDLFYEIYKNAWYRKRLRIRELL